MVDSGAKRDLRVGPVRTRRAEQNDKAMQRLRNLRDSKKRRDNIQEQYKALSQSRLDDGEDGEDGDKGDSDGEDEWIESEARAEYASESDGNDAPAPPKKGKPKGGSNIVAKASAQPIARKGAVSSKPVPPFANTKVDEGTLKSELIAKIAMRDQRTDHFNFTLKELKMVWENGGTGPTSGPTVEASEGIAGAFSDEELQDLGTIEADDSSNMKGAKIRKAPSHKEGTRLKFQSRSRVPSTSTAFSARSDSPAVSRASSPFVTSSRISSRNSLMPPATRNVPPTKPTTHLHSSFKPNIQPPPTNAAMTKPRGARASSLRHVQSNLTDAIEWDVDSEEEKAEYDQIEKDDTAYLLGETSCDEDGPAKKGKSKSSDYQGPVRAILEATLDKVFAILLTQGFFIEATKLDELIARTWRFCATRIVDDPTLNRYSISVNKLRAIKYRITSWQGKLKDAIKPKVAGEYGLTGTLDEVKHTIDQLLDHKFHTQPGAKPGTGYYQHPFLQTACDATIFSKRKGKPPIGVKFSKMFSKIPLPTIALICAIIHFLLEMFRSGEEEHDDTIIREMLEEYYNDHLQSLLNLAKVDSAVVDRIRTRMYQRAIKRVPVKPSITVKSESKAGSRVLSIKDIVRLKPQPAMDRKDDTEESESEPVERQGSSGKAKKGSKGEGEDEDEDEDEDGDEDDGEDEDEDQKRTGQDGETNTSAVGKEKQGAGKDADGNEVVDADKGAEAEDELGTVSKAKRQVVDEDEGQDSTNDEEEVTVKGGRNGRGKGKEKVPKKAQDEMQGKAKGGRRGSERERVDDKGTSQASEDADVRKGKGGTGPKAPKVVSPPAMTRSLRPRPKAHPPSTDGVPESGFTEDMWDNNESGRGEANGVDRKGTGPNSGKRKARLSADGALRISESPKKRGRRAAMTGV